jgi:hypothetical protein
MTFRTSMTASLFLVLTAGSVAACGEEGAPPAAEPGPATGEAAGELALVPCRADDSRGSCVNGFTSNGARCASSRECRDGTVCRGADPRSGGGHCFLAERPAERPGEAQCPRGSIQGYVLCAPGFVNEVVSRDPHCEACQADNHTARRCLAAGLTPERCRAILNDHRDDGVSIAERCRNAGLTPTQCRRLVSDDPDRDDAPVRGDLDGDRRVNEADVRILESQWGPVRGVNRADLDGSGAVDGADLGLLLGFWGDYN